MAKKCLYWRQWQQKETGLWGTRSATGGSGDEGNKSKLSPNPPGRRATNPSVTPKRVESHFFAIKPKTGMVWTNRYSIPNRELKYASLLIPPLDPSPAPGAICFVFHIKALYTFKDNYHAPLYSSFPRIHLGSSLDSVHNFQVTFLCRHFILSVPRSVPLLSVHAGEKLPAFGLVSKHGSNLRVCLFVSLFVCAINLSVSGPWPRFYSIQLVVSLSVDDIWVVSNLRETNINSFETEVSWVRGGISRQVYEHGSWPKIRIWMCIH